MDNKNKIAVIVGENIKLQLTIRESDAKWLASEAGIESSQMRKYLSGYLLMGIDKLVKICDALGCSPVDLLRGTSKEFLDSQFETFEKYKPSDE